MGASFLSTKYYLHHPIQTSYNLLLLLVWYYQTNPPSLSYQSAHPSHFGFSALYLKICLLSHPRPLLLRDYSHYRYMTQ